MLPGAVIAAKDLRQRVRDRSALVIGVVAPLVIAALMSLAFRGVDTLHVSLAVADADHGPVSGQLLSALAQPDLRQLLSTHRYPSATDVAAAVRDGRQQAGLVVPAGFSASVSGPSPLPLTVVTSVNNTIAGQVAASVARSFVAQVDADRLSVQTALARGAPVSQLPALGAAAAGLTLPVTAVTRPLGAEPLTAISYYAPAMALFFLLFTVSFTSRSFFVDKRQGMLERMRAAPIRPTSVLAGKALSAFVYGGASLTVVGLVTALVFGADWGDPLAAGVVSLAMVISVVCLTALVIAVSRTERQAEVISSVIVFGLALVGGNFVFVSVMPPVMRRLTLLTPNGWALRAYTDLATTGGGLGTVVVPILAILAISAVVAAVALALARRAVAA